MANKLYLRAIIQRKMARDHIFENTEIAFSLKSNGELKKAYLMFKLMGSPLLTDIGGRFTRFCFKLNLPVKFIVKSTIFKQFCGGETMEECLPVIKNMSEAGVCSTLDFSVEGKQSEADFDRAMNTKIELIKFARTKPEIPFAVMKPTALGRFDLWVKVSENKPLTSNEQAEWNRVEARFDAICKTAYECGVQLMVDGEESWMQTASDDLVNHMMQRYNKDCATVFNTLQCYRWDRFDYLKAMHEEAKQKGYKLGFKIVRGAYMEKERERAEEHGYESPICATKEDTDNTYDACVSYILDNLENIELFMGTHNEASCYLAMGLMQKKGVEKSDPRVWFSQLYGMSDHISFNLAKAGYNTAKLIPFGPVKEVIPYLIRRAEENTSVAGQTGRELMLLLKEKKRRGL